MCYGCWVEAKKPTKIPPTGRLCSALISRLYDMPHGGVGGNLHIITDDWNLKDSNIAFCIGWVISAIEDEPESEYVIVDPAQNEVELAICLLLERMTEAERYATMALQDGIIDCAGNEIQVAV